MPRQSITFTVPNSDWLKAQVESREYGTKSDVVNDLVRKARKEQNELEMLRVKLARAEQSGYSNRHAQQIRQDAKSRLTDNA